MERRGAGSKLASNLCDTLGLLLHALAELPLTISMGNQTSAPERVRDSSIATVVAHISACLECHGKACTNWTDASVCHAVKSFLKPSQSRLSNAAQLPVYMPQVYNAAKANDVAALQVTSLVSS